MKRPRREFNGLTWVGWLNILVLQWLFIRLAYTLPAMRSFTRWYVIRWIYPCTGWGGPYKCVGKDIHGMGRAR